MSESDIDRIYVILDDIRKEIMQMNVTSNRRASDAEARLNIVESQRRDCREEFVALQKILRGNGVKGWFRRVEALEAVAGMQSKWFWVAVMGGQGVLVAAISTVIASLM